MSALVQPSAFDDEAIKSLNELFEHVETSPKPVDERIDDIVFHKQSGEGQDFSVKVGTKIGLFSGNQESVADDVGLRVLRGKIQVIASKIQKSPNAQDADRYCEVVNRYNTLVALIAQKKSGTDKTIFEKVHEIPVPTTEEIAATTRDERRQEELAIFFPKVSDHDVQLLEATSPRVAKLHEVFQKTKSELSLKKNEKDWQSRRTWEQVRLWGGHAPTEVARRVSKVNDAMSPIFEFLKFLGIISLALAAAQLYRATKHAVSEKVDRFVNSCFVFFKASQVTKAVAIVWDALVQLAKTVGDSKFSKVMLNALKWTPIGLIVCGVIAAGYYSWNIIRLYKMRSGVQGDTVKALDYVRQNIKEMSFRLKISPAFGLDTRVKTLLGVLERTNASEEEKRVAESEAKTLLLELKGRATTRLKADVAYCAIIVTNVVLGILSLAAVVAAGPVAWAALSLTLVGVGVLAWRERKLYRDPNVSQIKTEALNAIPEAPRPSSSGNEIVVRVSPEEHLSLVDMNYNKKREMLLGQPRG